MVLSDKRKKNENTQVQTPDSYVLKMRKNRHFRTSDRCSLKQGKNLKVLIQDCFDLKRQENPHSYSLGPKIGENQPFRKYVLIGLKNARKSTCPNFLRLRPKNALKLKGSDMEMTLPKMQENPQSSTCYSFGVKTQGNPEVWPCSCLIS